MNSEQTFCLTCDDLINYRIRTETVEVTVRGTTFNYPEQVAFCPLCGNEVYVPNINDQNVVLREEAYRKAAHLISVSQINEILTKYNIGAGPLAKLMGFGEITINRYMNGQIPSKEHSLMLLDVLFSHKKMEGLLEDNKSLIAPVAYNKCRKALDQLNLLYGQKDIEIIARYILYRAGEITPLALQKLLYYAQAFYFALNGTELFSDDCQAWAHGPVFPEIYYQYKNYGFDPIDKILPNEDGDFSLLAADKKEFLNSVVEIFGMYSGAMLSRFTHSEKPWVEARGNLEPSSRSTVVISRESIHSYFEAIVNKYQINSAADISRYTEYLVSISK